MPVPIVNILDARDYAAAVREAAEQLGAGGVVVLPTETVYGATALLKQAGAIERLKKLRSGNAGKPLTPHVASAKEAERFLENPGELGRRMMRKLWPGPVGLQFATSAKRRAEVAAEFGIAEGDLYDGELITLRCPDHEVFGDVARSAGVLAVAAVGEAGRFEERELAKTLEGKVDLIVAAGPPRFSKPSTLVRVDGDSYHIVRSGVYDERTIRRLLKRTILFVCSGNTCRSPMAEAIARKLLSDKLGVDAAGLEQKGIEVMSAGSLAMAGAKATPEAVEAVKSLGADLTRHRSRPLTIELINQADVIYTMGRGHLRAVAGMVPAAEGKVAMLDPEAEVDDPIGSDVSIYNDLAGQLWKLIDARLKEQALT